jgi:hypothetical protein
MILFTNVRLAKEPQVDDNSRIGLGSDVTVREGIAMNLNMPGEVRGIRDHHLRLRIIEWNG